MILILQNFEKHHTENKKSGILMKNKSVFSTQDTP